MKSAVLIAYFFPPDGTAGVYRPLRFARRLAKNGWNLAVITLDAKWHTRYDPALLESVPKEIEIVRVADRDIWQTIQAVRARRMDQRLGEASPRVVAAVQRSHHTPFRAFLRSLVRVAEAWVYYPDMARFWTRPAIAATIKVCRRHQPRVLYVTGGPWSTFLVAHEVSRRTGVPYVLDFRDSWTLTANEDFEAFRPRWAALRDRRLLRTLFEEAQAVVFRYASEAESYCRAYRGALDPSKIHIIPNGYEGAVGAFQAQPGETCNIVYTGTVIPYRHDTFLEALTLFRQSFPREAQRLRFRFVGEGVEALGQKAAALGLGDMVQVQGPVPSGEVSRLLNNAHALLLLGVKPYQGYELCGSKVFGYLKAGRPILGILPDDESMKILQHVGVITVAEIDVPSKIVDALKRVVDAWEAGTLGALVPNADACQVYSAENQTAALERALEGLPPITPFIPGVVDIPASLQGKIGRNGWIDAA